MALFGYLAKGERLYHVRGFRGGYFADDGYFYADFPKIGKDPRAIAKVDLARREGLNGTPIEERSARQYGAYMLLTKPAKKEGSYRKDIIMEMRDTRSQQLVWSKPFPKEAPEYWVNSREGTMVVMWPTTYDAAKAEIKGDQNLQKEASALKDKEGNYLLQVLDAKTGKTVGQLIVETGKGSFHISEAFAVNDLVIIADSQNRVLVYSLATGQQKGKVFGAYAAVNPAAGLLCVENEEGRLTIYDIATMEKRDQFTFADSIAMMRFSVDGQKLFVLTANQTAYVLDVSTLSH